MNRVPPRAMDARHVYRHRRREPLLRYRRRQAGRRRPSHARAPDAHPAARRAGLRPLPPQGVPRAARRAFPARLLRPPGQRPQRPAARATGGPSTNGATTCAPSAPRSGSRSRWCSGSPLAASSRNPTRSAIPTTRRRSSSPAPQGGCAMTASSPCSSAWAGPRCGRSPRTSGPTPRPPACWSPTSNTASPSTTRRRRAPT